MCDTQLPDSDPPFTFGLPDNIERSVQRARSSAVILQLKTLGNTFMAEAKKFDRWVGATTTQAASKKPSNRSGWIRHSTEDMACALTLSVCHVREAWRAGLSPLLDLWQKLTSSSPDIGKKRDAEEVGPSGPDRP